MDDLHFQYRGEIEGANTVALEGVPTLDRQGNLYFVSPRSYTTTLSVIHHAEWHGENAEGVALVPELSEHRRGRVQFDVEVSADGESLYVADGRFGFMGWGGPRSADLFVARRCGGVWRRAPNSVAPLRTINTPDCLEYAAGISADELTLYFTRVAAPLTRDSQPQLWVARRTDVNRPFGAPRCILAAEGFVEGPMVEPDGRAIYYHRRENGRFVLYRIARQVSESDRTAGGRSEKPR